MIGQIVMFDNVVYALLDKPGQASSGTLLRGKTDAAVVFDLVELLPGALLA
ncbi:MAG TPA: hypothetical protein VGJ26_04965 [Pirellulales bacterium]